MKKIILLALTLFLTFLNAAYVNKEEALKMLAKAEDTDYPLNNEVYVENELVKLDVTGCGFTEVESYRKILNENGRSNNSVWFSYDEDYGSIEVEVIEVIKKDGEIVSYNPDEFLKEKENSFSVNSNIYSNTSKILTGSLSDLEVGDIVYTKKKSFTKKARMEGQYFGYFGLDSYSPYLNSYLEVSLPTEKELYVHEINKKDFSYDFTKKVEDDQQIYSFNMKNNPILVYEPGMEQNNFVAHHLKLTTVKSWEEISRWYNGLVEPHLSKINDDIRTKAKELTDSLKSRKEQAAALFYWVARNIRYVGVDKETNRPGYEPHDIDYTFKTRGGVCRDKAALLTAMLREVGIGSDVILISSGDRLNMEAPMVWFNHAITVSYDEKGEPEFFFDPTNETTKDFLPKYEEDNTYLIASEKGETLRTTPVCSPAENNSTVNLKLKIDKDNNAEGLISMEFSGLSDTFIRGSFTRLNRYEFKNRIASFVSKLHPNVKLVDFEYTDPNDKTVNMKIDVNITIKDYISSGYNKTFIPFDATRLDLQLLYNYVTNPFSLSERKYDFSMNGVFSFDINYELDYYKPFTGLSVPEIEELDYKGFKTSLKSNINKNKLSVKYHFETSKIHFKSEEFKELKQKLAALSKYDKLYMIGNTGGKDVQK